MDDDAPISAEDYLASCKRRFGTANPERMRVPAWEWMVRAELDPFVARRSLGLECNDSGLPDWCFDRMGAARVAMPDGRLITVAGEHEDSYDPDFCIYNDVIVRRGDEVEIYGYPRATFPPTDFHTATLAGGTIYIIGRLGYADERSPGPTPVFALDPETYRIDPVSASGGSPGWIHGHRARYREDLGVIEVGGGKVIALRDGEQVFRDGVDTYHLHVEERRWERVTDHSGWRQFALDYEFDERALEDRDWYTGEILERLGHPCELDRGPDADDEEASVVEWPAHEVIVRGVPVLVSDRGGEIRITVQGSLAQPEIDALLAGLRKLAEATHRPVTSVVEL